MPINLSSHDADTLEACLRRGALFELGHKRPRPGTVRRMWLRAPQRDALYGKNGADPTHWAAPQVQAFIQRYIDHEKMIIASGTSSLSINPDFKLLSTDKAQVFEIRFWIEPHKPDHVRLFGLFVATNCFIITSIGEKGKDEKGKNITINVGKEIERCCNITNELGISNPNLDVGDILTNYWRLS